MVWRDPLHSLRLSRALPASHVGWDLPGPGKLNLNGPAYFTFWLINLSVNYESIFNLSQLPMVSKE